MPVLQLDSRRDGLAMEDAPCHLDLSKLIQAGMKAFFNNPALSDITVVCPDGRALHCHSIILAAASRRLATALKQGTWTPGQQMPVKGVDSDALETLICAFYTAECPLELARVPALYDAAVKLEVPSLAPALEQYLGSALQPHNCCKVLELCLEASVQALVDIALDWIRSRVAEVVPSQEFRACRLEIAAYISKELAERSQLIGLQAAVSWLSAAASRSNLVSLFAEITGLSVEAIQAVAASGASLGPIGLPSLGGPGGAASSLQLSHTHPAHSHGHNGTAAALLAAGPALNLQQQQTGHGLGGAGAGLQAEGLGAAKGLGGLGGGGGGAGGGPPSSVQVLQLLAPASAGSQAVLVMPQGAGAGMTGESGGMGLQSLLLHQAAGQGAGGVKAGGLGAVGGGGGAALAMSLGGVVGGGGAVAGVMARGGGQGYGLDALADAAEGERVHKRLRQGGGGGPLSHGAGGFAVVTAESGSATSMHSDMSGDGQRMVGLEDSQPQRPLREADLLQPHTGAHHASLQQQQQLQASQNQQQQPRSKPGGGRGGSGGRRKRGASATDDDEDYAPSGGRSGGGGGSRSRAQDLVFDAEALMDGPTGGGGGSAGSGQGDDAAGGGNGAASAAGGSAGQLAGGGAGGSGAPGGTPVLMTGRRAPAQKGMCHVQGCHRSLLGLRDYYQRYKICEHHLKVSSVLKDGIPHRFCQQCGRFHPLSEFDGDRRSCRTMLQRHCHRRAKQKQELAEVLAQRFEEKQVAASMTAMMAAMTRGAQGSNVAGLPPMLQLQYLAGLPAAAAAVAAALDDDPNNPDAATNAMAAAAATSGGAVSDGGGKSPTAAHSGGGGSGGSGPGSNSGGGGRGRSGLPPGLHSPPSKAQLLEAVQRARKQHVMAQQLLGLAAMGAESVAGQDDGGAAAIGSGADTASGAGESEAPPRSGTGAGTGAVSGTGGDAEGRYAASVAAMLANGGGSMNGDSSAALDAVMAAVTAAAAGTRADSGISSGGAGGRGGGGAEEAGGGSAAVGRGAAAALLGAGEDARS